MSVYLSKRVISIDPWPLYMVLESCGTGKFINWSWYTDSLYQHLSFSSLRSSCIKADSRCIMFDDRILYWKI